MLRVLIIPPIRPLLRMSTSPPTAPPQDTVSWTDLAPGVEINKAAWTPQAKQVLTPDALSIVAKVHRALEPRRQELLAARRERQAAYDAGELPGFLPADEHPDAHGDWQVAPLPADLLRRRVEITGPVNNPKMVINMLSRTADGARADAAMLDFEDSMKPAWGNVMQGVQNVAEAAAGTLTFSKTTADGDTKHYALDPDDMPLLMVRIRGLHLNETNLRVDGTPISGAVLDFVLSMVHTAQTLMDQGKTPKYYVPKVEHYLEARWFNELFLEAQKALSIPEGTVKATFLIETLPAAFQMEEILYEYREHAAGLNGGRWDKIFSDIKVLMEHAEYIMADRGSIGMNRYWMRNYAELLIKICHRHGAFGMGGMAAFTPGNTPELREEQTRKVVEDKEFEASIGHDGCWVSHPYFIDPAMAPFTAKNQLDVIPDIDDQPDLLPDSSGEKTMAGLRKNVRVGIGYMKGWNEDIGCVAWDHLMEDLATLEISRAQTWQWLYHNITLDDGRTVTRELVRQVFTDELETIEAEVHDVMDGQRDDAIEEQLRRFRNAAEDASAIFTEATFRPFLTLHSEPAGVARADLRSALRAATA